MALLLLVVAISVLNYFSLNVESLHQKINEYLESSMDNVVIITSPDWNDYQRVEIIGIAREFKTVQSVFVGYV